jgi:hypothetical protein
MKGYRSVKAFDADTNKTTAVPSDYIRALIGLTRRPVQVEGDIVLAYFTANVGWRSRRRLTGVFSS